MFYYFMHMKITDFFHVVSFSRLDEQVGVCGGKRCNVGDYLSCTKMQQGWMPLNKSWKSR
jgi:hypothetical protein